MNINKHNVAMRWITRRRTNEVAGLYESFPGTFSAYQEALSSGFQGTMEEFMQIQSIPQSERPFTGKVGGLVEPGVTHYGKKTKITPEKYKEEFENFKKNKKGKVFTDQEFANHLNKNYFHRTGSFTEKTVSMARKRLNLPSTWEGKGSNIKDLRRVEKVNDYLQEIIPKLNAGEKYFSKADVAELVQKKFNFKPITDEKSRFRSKAYPLMDTLDSKLEKVEKTLKNMLMEEKPLNDFWPQALQKRTGFDRDYIGDVLREGKIPTYEVIKDQGAEYIRGTNLNDANHGFLKDLSFSDQMEKGARMKEGRPIYSLGKEGAKKGGHASHTVKSFAFRSWDQSQGNGPVKLINRKTGKPITWDYGLTIRDFDFTYNGKKYYGKKLLDVDYLKKNFPEVYKNQLAANRLRARKVDDPFNPGKKISLDELVKKVQIENYGWKGGRTFEVLHGSKGVMLEPFTNLRYNTRDINQAERSLSQFLKAGSISQTQYNQSLKNLNKAFNEAKDYDQAIIDRQTKLATDISKGQKQNFKQLLQGFCGYGK